MTTPDVCKLAGYSSSKLLRLVREEKFPKPIDRGGDGFVWNRSTVLAALGLQSEEATEINPWEVGLQ